MVCSANNLITKERAEGATRCRDASTETFANRASSQVGSDVIASRESDEEEEVGAGERGSFGSLESGVFGVVVAVGLVIIVGAAAIAGRADVEASEDEDGRGTGIAMVARILVMFCQANSSCCTRARKS